MGFRGKPFEGKVAVVTGGGGVLCSVVAEALAESGASVAVLDLRQMRPLYTCLQECSPLK